MAFILAPKTTIRKPVTVYEEQDDGEVLESKMNVTYNRLKKPDISALLKKVYDPKDEYNWEDALREHVKHVEVVDEKGKEVEFDSELMEALLAYLPTFQALENGFTALNTGKREIERRKNSEKRESTGQ